LHVGALVDQAGEYLTVGDCGPRRFSGRLDKRRGIDRNSSVLNNQSIFKSAAKIIYLGVTVFAARSIRASRIQSMAHAVLVAGLPATPSTLPHSGNTIFRRL